MIPVPAPLKPQSRVYDLKERLDWGEPALTIIDVRDRAAFNVERILGAVSMPMAGLIGQAQAALEPVRDIYVYGESDEQTAEAAEVLRTAGFNNVAALQGGLPAWKAAGFQVENIPAA